LLSGGCYRLLMIGAEEFDMELRQLRFVPRAPAEREGVSRLVWREALAVGPRRRGPRFV
jgi:hypothetical protein